jgi:hypothetical protein
MKDFQYTVIVKQDTDGGIPLTEDVRIKGKVFSLRGVL